MLSKKHDDLITRYLDSHIAACSCVLNNYSNEGPHHQVKVQCREEWSETSYNELQKVQCLKIDIRILILQKLSHKYS